LVIIVAIFALRIDRQMLVLPFTDRGPISSAFAARPDRLWPQFPRFIEEVRARTNNGDSIALVVPSLDWDQGYSYAFYRASYLLAGREVLPVATADRALHPENFRSAKYVAVWGREFPPTQTRTVMWRGEGGVLLRR
jgi:hypothetical protein